MHQFQYLNYQDIKKRINDLILIDSPNKITKEPKEMKCIGMGMAPNV